MIFSLSRSESFVIEKGKILMKLLGRGEKKNKMTMMMIMHEIHKVNGWSEMWATEIAIENYTRHYALMIPCKRLQKNLVVGLDNAA